MPHRTYSNTDADVDMHYPESQCGAVWVDDEHWQARKRELIAEYGDITYDALEYQLNSETWVPSANNGVYFTAPTRYVEVTGWRSHAQLERYYGFGTYPMYTSLTQRTIICVLEKHLAWQCGRLRSGMMQTRVLGAIEAIDINERMMARKGEPEE